MDSTRELDMFLLEFNEDEVLDNILDGSQCDVEAKTSSTDANDNALQVTEESVNAVLQHMEKGYCKSCPASLKALTRCCSSEKELCKALAPLQTFIVKGQHTSRCKEKSLTIFHCAAVTGFPSIAAVTGCEKFAVLLALEMFTHLLERAFPPPQASTSPILAVHLSTRDRDIVSHIGGSIISKLKRRYKSHKQELHEECVGYLCRSCGNSEAPMSLTKILDRGGLTYITPTALLIFTDLECTFRDCFNKITGNVSLTNYKSRVSDEVTCSFYEATCESSVSDDVKEVVLTDVIKLFFKIRCHNQLQKIVRTFRAKKNIARKQKPLRKCLKYDNM